MDLWVAAAQSAKELVKMPNLDEMAKDDDYIHTESLNVSNKAGMTKQEQQQEYMRQESSVSSHSAAYPATPSSTVSSWMSSPPTMAGASGSLPAALPHTASSASSSSWSLLDRNPSIRHINASSSTNFRLEEATARLNAMVFETGDASTTNSAKESSKWTSSHHTHTSSSQPATSSRMAASASGSIASGTITMSDEDHDDDDGSQDSYDEDDPILSLLQQQRGGSNHGSTSSNTKNRFMNELDQRLAQPSTDEQPLLVNPLQIESGDDNNDTKSVPHRLWPWQQRRQHPKPSRGDEEGDNNDIPRPLWARPKKKKSKPADDGFVLVSSGNLGFSDEERQALANLQKQQAVPESGNLFSDHPRESFIALTLVLGAAVYFYSRMTTADDLAL
eukprot:scaffold362_cov176-Amphora_coffeaeformis.AAC.44